MYLRIGLLYLFLSNLALAAPATIKNIRIWAAPDNTRIVLDTNRPVNYNAFTLADPHRAVIDLKDTVMRKAATQPGKADQYLRRIRTGKTNNNDFRVVLDLKKKVHYKSFQLPPNKLYSHRLVIDLYDEKEKTQAAFDIKKQLANKTRPPEIIIAVDAGHGGEDPGAIGPSNTYEKDIVLTIAKQLAAAINKQRGMRAVLIRKGDYYMSLRKRINKARKHKADLFLSIHADAFRDSRVQGSSVYVLSKKGASSEAAKWLAHRENQADLIGGVSLDNKDDMLASVLLDMSQTGSLEASINVAKRVLSQLKKVGKVHQRSVQSAGFVVLKSPDIPSVLIETAFISNPSEEKKLLSKRYQRNVVAAILAGVRSYFSEFAPQGTLLASRKHVIVSGETLSTIAQQYRISTERLRRYNGLKSDLVRAGDTLRIPADT